eukprot:3849579-Rhodomonas_salina.1
MGTKNIIQLKLSGALEPGQEVGSAPRKNVHQTACCQQLGVCQQMPANDDAVHCVVLTTRFARARQAVTLRPIYGRFSRNWGKGASVAVCGACVRCLSLDVFTGRDGMCGAEMGHCLIGCAFRNRVVSRLKQFGAERGTGGRRTLRRHARTHYELSQQRGARNRNPLPPASERATHML